MSAESHDPLPKPDLPPEDESGINAELTGLDPLGQVRTLLARKLEKVLPALREKVTAANRQHQHYTEKLIMGDSLDPESIRSGDPKADLFVAQSVLTAQGHPMGETLLTNAEKRLPEEQRTALLYARLDALNAAVAKEGGLPWPPSRESGLPPGTTSAYIDAVLQTAAEAEKRVAFGLDVPPAQPTTEQSGAKEERSD